MAEKRVGIITHYYGNIGVGVIQLEDELRVGDTIHIKGYLTDFELKVESMQIEHQNIDVAEAGKSVGLKVSDHVREHDVVYKLD